MVKREFDDVGPWNKIEYIEDLILYGIFSNTKRHEYQKDQQEQIATSDHFKYDEDARENADDRT